MSDSTARARTAQFRKTRISGVLVRHLNNCPAAFGEGRCRCIPSWRGRRRNPATGRPEWSPVAKDRNEVLTWLAAGEKATAAINDRAEQCRTFASLATEWMDGVQSGRIQRRRRGKPEPYAPSTIPGYRRDLKHLLEPRFGERPADEIDEREWQDFFDELARDGLSYSRLANIKAVASSIYAWSMHRTRRHVRTNPLAHVELPPNLGKRRERVALADEAASLLALLCPEDRVPYAIAFYAGLRRGEVHRLDWLDVEMVDGKPGNWLRVAPAPGNPATGVAYRWPRRCALSSSRPTSARRGRPRVGSARSR